MKKTLCIIASLALLFTFVAACNGTDDPTPAPAANTPAPADTPTDAADTPTEPAAPAEDFDFSRRISVYTRENGSGTRDAFTSLTGVGDDMYEEAVEVTSTGDLRQNVAGNEYAIGYISVGSLNDEVKALTVDGIAPSDDTIKDGSYKLWRSLLVCVTEDKQNDPLVADFIAFMLSAQGQAHSGSSWTAYIDDAPDYEPSGLSGELRIGGSTSVEPLMIKMVEEYKELNPDVNIDVSAVSSGAGISGAQSGELDIGMSSRDLRDGEQDLIPIIIALDGVAVVVHPSNPIENMTIDQIKGIFIGETTAWADVG